MTDKEQKEVKVNLAFTPEKLLTYGAIVDAVLGVVWAICAVAQGDYTSTGAMRAAGFFEGLFFAVLGGLVIYGLSLIVKSKQ